MISQKLELSDERLFASTQPERQVASRLYDHIRDLPIISPHGHTDPAWFALNHHFADAASLLVTPDHYILRMLYSQGVALEDLGVSGGKQNGAEARAIWRLFADHYHLFRGTPTRIWLDHVFHDVFGLRERLSGTTANHYFDQIGEQLATDDFRPRALMDRFNIELIATTEGALDPLTHHKSLDENWSRRVVTTFRPDDVTDALRPDFADNVKSLAEITGEDTSSWQGYLQALRTRRVDFAAQGATATDHGPASAQTADLSATECEALFEKCIGGQASSEERALFGAQMLTEMAGMSCDDGMVMQLHAGSHRNHNAALFASFGADRGADIPMRTDYVSALKPLLDKYGNDPRLTLILFTLDETSYARELAPLAGHYPCLKLGPAWWFHDSPEGMLRYRRQTTETAGFYNTAGFNDDTRAFLSIPARHDVARRMDCRFLAELVAQHRMEEDEAHELAADLAYNLCKQAYRLDGRESGQNVGAAA
ncbi:MAG: glucuronate isomerase [Sphingorhabdus sp.]